MVVKSVHSKFNQNFNIIKKDKTMVESARVIKGNHVVLYSQSASVFVIYNYLTVMIST